MTNAIDHAEKQTSMEIVLVDLGRVLPTEQVNSDFVDTLAAGMRASGVWTHPLLLESSTLAILDGHHRFAAAKQIGLCTVPAMCVSYRDSRVHLESWRTNHRYTPEEILHRARTGDLLPYKSTRHVTDFVLPQLRLPLAILRNRDAHGRPVPSAGLHPRGP